MPAKRQRLAARRKAAGFSQEQLAERLGIDCSTVARWESGETEPQPWIRPRLARVLQVSLDQLDHLLAGGGQAETEAGAAERMSHALTHPGSTDLVTVADLRNQVHHLDEQYIHVASSSLLARAGQCLGQVRFLAAHATNSRVRRKLYAVEAEAAILMGQLVWDASQRRDHASARMYLDQAIDAARQVRDPAAEGLALLRRAMIALYGERNPREGLALAEQTAETTSRVSDVLTGLAILHAAEAHAMLGELASCEQALAAADTRFGRVGELDTAIELYSATQFGRMAGSCYLFLEDTRRAQALLEAVATAHRDQSKPQAIVLGNLALALIRQGDLDEAAGRLHQAIDIIELNRGGGGLNIVFTAAREMRPWRTLPAVQEVSDRLLTLMAG
jgi:transcriptional regulator with XRE-family HTH domain